MVNKGRAYQELISDVKYYLEEVVVTHQEMVLSVERKQFVVYNKKAFNACMKTIR